jgi:DNA-binding NarL/FixJ family response regulator
MTEQATTEPEDSDPIRVVIAEDAYLVREALTRILASAARVEVAGSYGDRDSLMRAIPVLQPDAIVTDIRMPPTGTDEGIQIARQLRESEPQIGIVVLSQYADPSYMLALLESGSAGRAYLLKERISDAGQLVAAIEAVASGGSVIDPLVVESLVRVRTNAVNSPLSELTARERDVLAEIAQGKSNGAIADSLYLTKRAVEKHVNSIFMKLDLGTNDDVSRRVKAALIFLAAEDGH